MRGSAIVPAAPVLLTALLTILVAVPAISCAPADTRDDGTGTRAVLVARKALDRGELVASAVDEGAIGIDRVPADLARGDVLTSDAGIRCLVLLDPVARGAVLRRRALVEPTPDRSTVVRGSNPTGC